MWLRPGHCFNCSSGRRNILAGLDGGWAGEIQIGTRSGPDWASLFELSASVPEALPAQRDESPPEHREPLVAAAEVTAATATHQAYRDFPGGALVRSSVPLEIRCLVWRATDQHHALEATASPGGNAAQSENAPRPNTGRTSPTIRSWADDLYSVRFRPTAARRLTAGQRRLKSRKRTFDD